MFKIATKFAPAAESFELARQAGFTAVELYLNQSWLERVEEVIRTAADYPFKYVLHFPNQIQLSLDAVAASVRLYQALGCRAMVIHRPVLERYESRLLGLDDSVRLAVENHHQTAAEIGRWATQNRWLTLDVSHVWKCSLRNGPLDQLTEMVDQLFARFGDRIIHVHLPGYQPGSEEHVPMHHAREVVTRVFDIFARRGYSEVAVSEIDLPFQTLDNLRQDQELFATWKAGQSVGAAAS